MARELGHVLLVCLLQVVLTLTQPAENIAEPGNTSRAKVSVDNADDISPRIIKSAENIYNSHEVEVNSHEHAVGQHAFAIPQQRSIEVEIDYDDSTGQWNTGNNDNAFEPNGRLAPEPASENNISPLIVKWLPLYINVQDLPNSINVHLNKKMSENIQLEKDKNPNRWFNVPDRYGNIMPNAPLPPESANPRMRFQSPPVLKAGDYSARFIADPQSSRNPHVELINPEEDSSVLSASGRSNMSDKLDVQEASERIMSDESETHSKLDQSDAAERSGAFDDYKKTDIPQTTDRPLMSTTSVKSDMYETTKNTNIPVSNTYISEKSDTSNASIVSHVHDAAERSDMSDADNKEHIPEVSSRSDVSDAVERSDMAITTSPTNMPEASERFDMSESYNKTDNSAAFDKTDITNASERSDILNVSNTIDRTDAPNMPNTLNNIDSNSTEMAVATVRSNIPVVSGRTNLQNISENLDAIDVSDTSDVSDRSDISDMDDSSEDIPAEQRYLLMQFLKYWRDKIMFARSGQAAGMQYNPRASHVAPRSINDQNSAQADYSSRKYRMAPNNHEACKDHMEDGQ